jgi:hypothetical protein
VNPIVSTIIAIIVGSGIITANPYTVSRAEGL